MIGSKNLEEIEEALLYIDEHFGERLTLRALAEKLYLSNYYFHRMFKTVVGKTVASYIRERRILYARKLLCETDLPITEIRKRCGFGSLQAFSKTFKKMTGRSPSEYRELGEQPIIPSAKEIVKHYTA